jgi:hypothetical protein
VASSEPVNAVAEGAEVVGSVVAAAAVVGEFLVGHYLRQNGYTD